jgi:hypothetical protein
MLNPISKAGCFMDETPSGRAHIMLGNLARDVLPQRKSGHTDAEWGFFSERDEGINSIKIMGIDRVKSVFQVCIRMNGGP